jgi:hypothetical protein
LDLYKGNALPAEFTVREFYEFDDVEIKPCDVVNLQALNNEINHTKVAGIPALIEPFTVTGDFVIKNFAKFDQLYPDADVEIKSYLGDKENVSRITGKFLRPADEEGVWDLHVHIESDIEIDYTGLRNLSVIAKANANGKETIWTEVLSIDNIYTVQDSLEGIKNNPDGVFFTEKDALDHDYIFDVNFNVNGDLIATKEGWGWPKVEDNYINTYTLEGNTSVPIEHNSGVVYNETLYRFLAKKFELEEVYDLTGFMLKLTWNKVPEIVSTTGALKDVVVQVCATSEEAEHDKFMNGNKAAPIMFICNFDENEGVLYPGKSFIKDNTSFRRITFGRRPVPVKDIFIRIGLPKDSELCIKNINLDID